MPTANRTLRFHILCNIEYSILHELSEENHAEMDGLVPAETAAMGLEHRRRGRPGARRDDRTPSGAAAGTDLDFADGARTSIAAPCRALERFPARDGTRIGVPALSGAGDRRASRIGDRRARLVRIKRPPSTRWRTRSLRAASRPMRPTFAATALRHARRHRLCRPARGRSRRFCRGRPQDLTPTAPLTLLGHSAGGGFALRVASSPIQNLFARTVLLAPYLGYDAPTNRPDSGGWASADIPRILGLLALRGLGIDCCEALPVLAFAVPPNSEKDPGVDLFVPADAQFRDTRLQGRSRRRDQARSL